MNFRLTVTESFNPNDINLRPIIKKTSQGWAERTTNNVKIAVSGTKLKVKVGRLRNNVRNKVSQKGNITKIEIGVWNVPYAEVQDKKQATTIRPSTRRFLTVPVNESVKGRARQYANTFIIANRSGTLLIVQKVGKRGLRPLFILKKFVIIRGTGYLTDTVNLMKPFLSRDIEVNVNAIKAG